MKKITTALKLLAVGLFALNLSACGLMPPSERKDVYGMVWRATIVKQYADTSKVGTSKDEGTVEVLKLLHFVPSRDSGLRAAFVQYGEGWDTHTPYAVVPDQVEFSQIKRGALVDVMEEQWATSSYETAHFRRILRVVCESDDDKCIDAEKTAKRYKAVVDEHPPADVSAKYGATYLRRVTPEEIAKYK